MSRTKSIEIGDVVAGKYRLLAMIGEGGMGVVYLAEHALIEKRVALKVLKAEYSTKPELVSRFQQEAISASRIKHPNVLDVFDFGQLEDGSFFLAMEYLSGHDLAAELAQTQAIVPDRAVRVALQMCRALAAAHGRGVVHRDLKPENVFLHLTEDGDEIVKIVDFGIAQLKGKEEQEETATRRRRLTRTGMIFGTPEYMSPEQAKGLSVDLRSDIYGLGVILYEMVTGAVPFTGTTFMAVLSAHLTQPIPPMRVVAPDIAFSNELEQAVHRSLEKDPEKRFQSMREFAAALQQTPEGRVAAPLGGMLPVPEVNVGSFRPARDASIPTTPQFQRLAPLPTDLTARVGIRASEGTLMGGLDASFVTPPAEALAIARSTPRRWLAAAGIAGGLVVVVAAAAVTMLLYRTNREQLRPVAGVDANRTDQASIAGIPSAAKGESGAAPGLTQGALAVTAPAGAAAASDAAATNQPKNNESDSPAANAANTANTAQSNAAQRPAVLSVQSNLPGATVTKDGFQVCDQTPCTVEVARGSAVELVGTKGYARGVAKVLAQQDQTVNIQLIYAKPAGKKKEPSNAGLCEVTVDGLKILRPCQ